jgi:hypothetical protein
MPFARRSKRERDESDSPLRDTCTLNRQKLEQQPNSKLHLHRSSDFHYPPQFFDNLSEIALTKGALREFDRRNSLRDLQTRPLQVKHPITRGYLAKKRALARNGGPDLQALRGVCFMASKRRVVINCQAVSKPLATCRTNYELRIF